MPAAAIRFQMPLGAQSYPQSSRPNPASTAALLKEEEAATSAAGALF